MEFVRFFGRHVLPAIAALVGAIVVIVGYALEARDVAALGIPIVWWQAIGAALFMGAMVAILYRWESRQPSVAPLEKQRPEPKISETEQLARLGTEALILAADIRDYLGLGYQYGLGLPMHSPPPQLRSRVWVLMNKFGERGLAPLTGTQGLKDPILFELVMRYFEYVGRFLKENPSQAKPVSARIAADLAQAAAQSRQNPNFSDYD